MTGRVRVNSAAPSAGIRSWMLKLAILVVTAGPWLASASQITTVSTYAELVTALEHLVSSNPIGARYVDLNVRRNTLLLTTCSFPSAEKHSD